MNKKTITLSFVYLLSAVSVVAYYPALLNHIISWEDSDLFNIVSLLLKGKTGLFSHPEHPPLELAFIAFQRSFSQYGYFLFHALSVLGHAANAILLFFLVRKIFASERIAVVVSLLFALHPVAVGTVAWLSGQSTIFATLFLLSASLSYLSFKRDGKRFAWWMAVVFSAFFYSIAPPALNLILLLLGIDLLLEAKLKKEHFIQKWPMIFLWLVSLCFRAIRSGGWQYLQQLYYDSVAVMRLGIVDVIARVFFPWHDTLVASADEIAARSSFYGESILPLAFLVLAVLVIWNRKKEPTVFYGFLFLVLAGLPLFTGHASGNWVLIDRTFYLSVAGIYMALGSLLEKLILAWERRKGAATAAYLVCGCLVLVLLYASRSRTEAWKDSLTFWGKAHAENPKNTFILTQRGMDHYSRYEIAPSLTDLSMVVELASGDPESYINRGIVRLDAFDYSDAIADFRRALQLRSTDQRAYYDLGLAYVRSSILDSAEAAFSRAIDLDPAFAQAYEGRANALARSGSYVLAFADYHRALELDPDYAEAYGNRAFAFLQTGNYGRGLSDFSMQIKLAPYKVDARIHCGYTALLLGDTATAMEVFSGALRADSTNGRTYLLGVSKIFLKTEEEARRGERLFRRLGVR